MKIIKLIENIPIKLNSTLICYHYCTSEFLADLQEKRIIKAYKTNFKQKL